MRRVGQESFPGLAPREVKSLQYTPARRDDQRVAWTIVIALGAVGIVVLTTRSSLFGENAGMKNLIFDLLFGKSATRRVDRPREIGAMQVASVSRINMKSA